MALPETWMQRSVQSGDGNPYSSNVVALDISHNLTRPKGLDCSKHRSYLLVLSVDLHNRWRDLSPREIFEDPRARPRFSGWLPSPPRLQRPDGWPPQPRVAWLSYKHTDTPPVTVRCALLLRVPRLCAWSDLRAH